MAATVIAEFVDLEAKKLSVPLSSGQWLQRYDPEVLVFTNNPFSPLVIGSMAATTPP